MSLGFAANIGAEVVTRDTVYKSAGSWSFKFVTVGGIPMEGAFGPIYGATGQGVTVPAGTIMQYTAKVAPDNGVTLRVAVNCFDSSDHEIRETHEFVTGTAPGAFQTVVVDVPALNADCYQQISITTGSTGASLPSTAANWDELTIVTVPPPPTAPVLESESTTLNQLGTTFTKSFTVPAGLTNAALFVVQEYDDPTRSTTGTQTWNGNTLTRISGPAGSGAGLEIFQLKNPTAGTGNVVLTHSAQVQGVLRVYLFSNVDQTTPTTISATSSASATHPTVTVTPSATEYAFGGISYSATTTSTLTKDATGTENYNVKQFSTFGIHGAGARYGVGAGSAITFGWTVGGASGQPSTIFAVRVKGAAVVLPSAPTNSVAPVISGATTTGAIVAGSNGTWANTPTGYEYQYLRETAAGSGSYIPIDFATSATYTTTPADNGLRLKLTVTASNAGGATSSTSAAFGPIGQLAPVLITAPITFGFRTVDTTLEVDNGLWLYEPTSYTYQWKTNGGVTGGSYSDVVGATSNTLDVTQADNNATFVVAVTATNATGSTTATSTEIGPLGPVVPVVDDFNRANENPAADPWGPPVQNGIPRLQLLNGRLMSSTGSVSQSTRTDILAADVTVTVRMPDAPAESGRGIGIHLRAHHADDAADAEDYVLAYLLGNGFSIFELVGGNQFAQLSAWDTTHALAAGERLRFGSDGSTLTGSWLDADGVESTIASASGVANVTAGLVGVEINSPTASIDDFDIQIVVPPPAPFGTYTTTAITTLSTWIDDHEVVFTFPWQPRSLEEAFVLDSLADVFSITKT